MPFQDLSCQTSCIESPEVGRRESKRERERDREKEQRATEREREKDRDRDREKGSPVIYGSMGQALAGSW